jgi:hypothetical protein
VKGRLELGLRLFLVAMLLDPPLPWSERVPVLMLAGAGLAVPAALRSRWLWGALFAATALPLALSWPLPDNHDYLTAAFALAGACALLTADAEAAMARSARLLVAITFSMAMLWKAVLSPDFLDGRFFSVTLLTDGRFEDLAVLATDLDWDGWEENDQALGDVLAGEVSPERSTFHAPPRLRAVAGAMTVATLLAEGAVALCFLWPGRRGPARVRDAVLLLFAVGTYSFATVRGFGWLLVALGVAQSDPERTAARWGYLGAFALIGVYRAVPWTSWLVERFSAG